jgi:glycine/D-amino acid oxidase-like deaminating enzyme
MARSYDTIVVGVGILGASTAHYLAKKRAGRILLLDRLEPASGGTGKSAAIVRSFYTIPLMARLARDAVRLFHNLKEETGSDGGFYATGFTQLVPPEWVETTREKVAMHRSLGIDTDFVPETEWAQRFPWLNADSVGAIVFEASSGYADPVQTTESFFVASFIRASGEFRPRTPVRALLRHKEGVTGVLLEDAKSAPAPSSTPPGRGRSSWPRAPASSRRCAPCASRLPSGRCGAAGRCRPRRSPIPSRRSTCGP